MTTTRGSMTIMAMAIMERRARMITIMRKTMTAIIQTTTAIIMTINDAIMFVLQRIE